ncbi:MAG: hypothetical protein KAI72_00960 [Candidatus Pacebacteria bacterium]|nr:hypothetical protein [Candidatus Paceibacterota bacterium]
MEKMKCQGKKDDGSACEGHVIKDSQFCFFHDPKKKEEQKEAAIKGGSRGKRIPLPPIDLKDGVYKAINRVINEMRAGTLPAKEGRAIIHGIKAYMTVF